MARLLLLYDPTGALEGMPTEMVAFLGAKQARLDVPDDLSDVDIYEIARSLAELLLEQL
jgi:hypothetical protein